MKLVRPQNQRKEDINQIYKISFSRHIQWYLPFVFIAIAVALLNIFGPRHDMLLNAFFFLWIGLLALNFLNEPNTVVFYNNGNFVIQSYIWKREFSPAQIQRVEWYSGRRSGKMLELVAQNRVHRFRSNMENAEEIYARFLVLKTN
jgi:hypothetical protein